MAFLLILLDVIVLRPVRAVRTLLTPRTPRDRRIATLQTARAWLGVASLVVVLINGQGDAHYGTVVRSLAGAPAVKALIAFCAFVVAGLVLIISGPRGHRAVLAWRSMRPALVAVGVVAIPALLFLAAAWRLDLFTGHVTGRTGFLFAVFLLTALPLVPAVVAAVYFGVRNSFMATDVHPEMPAVVGLVVGAITVGQSTGSIVSASGTLERRLGWLALGGGIVVLALAAWELWTLESLHRRTVGPSARSLWRSPPAPIPVSGVMSRGLLGFAVLPLAVVLLGPVVVSNHRSSAPASASEASAPARSTGRPSLGTATRVPVTHSASTAAQPRRPVTSVAAEPRGERRRRRSPHGLGGAWWRPSPTESDAGAAVHDDAARRGAGLRQD
ncbi:hypothetical protein [Nakamurella endophytica]|uniref:Uncharacterized protein n=1 Tax=Nakamurella endophytica TaxID=1748367 RepID=A0A917SNI7_9ACTN|nr:hypothetical protein [Nakamurella endophytica]GGL90806.1 hypothetical protein GCM10011594_08040 [Nakamurella endophytica]